jgi:potassium channel
MQFYYLLIMRHLISHILQGKESIRGKQLESDITFHIGKLESDLALKVNRTAFDGDMYQLTSLIRAGADPKKTDYDGRSPLVRSLKRITMISCYQ